MKHNIKAKHELEEEELLNLDEETLQLASETRYPSPILKQSSQRSDEEKIALIENHFRQIMEVLGLDLTDDSLAKTPYRIAKMYVQEIFSGLDSKNFPSITFMEEQFYNAEQSQIIFVKAGFTSFCEHHFVPMKGNAYVAYLPNKKLIGLSKIARIVQFFSQRPQIQERLSAQIADSLSILLETDHVAVSLTAEHYCVLARGVKDENGYTTTNILKGQFKTDKLLREEFFAAIKPLIAT